MLKRLNGSWYLTDGILSPVRLDAPGCVADALRGAGLLADGEGAAELLKAEWIYRREWRYSLSPEGGFPADGRAYVSLFGLHGEWTALLDGRELARGDDSEAEIALPAGARGATLTLVFAAPSADARWPRIGLDGGCLLRTVGGAAITSLLLNTPDDAPWTACAVVNAERESACEVRYALEIGGERTETIVQAPLSPGENLLEHTVHESASLAAFASGAGFSDRPATIAVSLRAEVLLDGAVSDARDARLCLAANDAAPRGFAGADAVTAARAAEVGANALCAPDASRARMAAAEHGLMFVPYHSLATQRAARACQRYEALLQLAGDESRVLDPALWRLTGCDPDAPELAALLSPDGDLEAACRVSRYHQAVSLRDAAEHARMKRVPFLLDGARDETPVCASGALFDYDGAARPAYFALADAWRPEHAFIQPPESFPADGIVSVPVFYLSDEKAPSCTVNVRAYSMDGQERITVGFPVPPCAAGIVGRLCVEMPEDGLLLLRASVLRDGSCVSRSDRLIAQNEDCLSGLCPVQLLRDGNNLRNASACVAIGVSVPAARYFGALLPGEMLALGEPRLNQLEALNPRM